MLMYAEWPWLILFDSFVPTGVGGRVSVLNVLMCTKCTNVHANFAADA